MFTTSEPGNSDAAFLVLPNSNDPKIPEAVSRGYLVFTRADIDTEDARVGSTARRDAAFRSGAQIISTDYPEGEAARWSDYAVRFKSGRCRPMQSSKRAARMQSISCRIAFSLPERFAICSLTILRRTIGAVPALGIQAAYLYGPFAKSEEDAVSDIDVLVVGKPKATELANVAGRLEKPVEPGSKLHGDCG